MADPQHPGADPPTGGGTRAEPTTELTTELRALGRALDVPPPPPDLAAAVLARVPARPPRPSAARRVAAAVAGWPARGRRAAVAVLLALVLAVAAGTPAAARIARWLGLGGVVVVEVPGAPAPPPDPRPAPAAGPELTLAQAGERVGFAPAVPAELGPPDRVTVSPDGVVVSMQWGEGPAARRLDQFVGGVAPVFRKRLAGEVEPVSVAGAEGLWIARPHTLEHLDATGRLRVEPARTSGPSLVWSRWPVTLRLEGEPDRERALAIAASVR